ncbi:MAG: cobalt ECF transporter T component CbiQ [Methanobacteriaceae archaeon]
MNINVGIDYIAHNNRFSTVNPFIKIIISTILMIMVLIANEPIISILITIVIMIVLILIAKVPYRFYLKFLSIPLIFSIITCVFLVLFFGNGAIIFDFGIAGIVIREDAFDLGLRTFFRVIASFSCLGLLSLTTPISEILNTLGLIKIPSIIIEIALLMYNTIFIFLNQVDIMSNAQKTRLGYMGIKNSYRSLGLLISNLFFKSLDKSDQLQISLDSRGYDSKLPVYKSSKYKN